MYKKFTFLTILLFTLLSEITMAEHIIPSKKYITRKIENPDMFRQIEVLGSPDVEYTQSTDGNTTISIYGSDNLVDLVEAVVSNETLKVKFKRNISIRGELRLKVIVSSPFLSGVNIKGSGDVEVKGLLKTDRLTLRIQGSGDIKAEHVQCDRVEINIQGSGDITLKDIDCHYFQSNIHGSGDLESNGRAGTAIFTVIGSGDTEAGALIAQKVEATIIGSGDITCHAEKELIATVRGSGDIKYKGNPVNITTAGNTDNIEKD